MKKTAIQNLMLRAVTAFALIIVCLSSCSKEKLVETTSTNLNITNYLDSNPGEFSEFRKILEITGTASFLQAYGNYTLFAPTNDGVKKYLEDMGKTSVEQVEVDKLKDIVRLHLIEDTIRTTEFSDGKLPKLTMLGQYLVTGASNAGGVTKLVINRQANLTIPNIRLGNGYIHVIDNVLRPAYLTLAQTVEAHPDYNIFEKALKETGLYDTLNVLPAKNPIEAQKYLTFIAESDQVLEAAGFLTYEKLRDTYNSGPANLKDPANGFHAYMAYHIVEKAQYLADFASIQAHKTLAKPEIITAQYVNQQVLLNDVTFNNIYEAGFLLDRAKSDVTASNGVLHHSVPYKPANGAPTTGHFEIKKRFPFPVYWNINDFPEGKNITVNDYGFNKASAAGPSPIAGWYWPNNGNGINYRKNQGDNWVKGDYLNLVVGISNRNAWIDMQSPLIVRGKYAVWVCYRRQNQSNRWPNSIGTKARILVDGEALEKSFFFAEPPPSGTTSDLEALGWKYYTSTGDPVNPFPKQTYLTNGQTDNSPWVAKRLGVVTIASTDVHTVRVLAQEGSQNTNNMDMIHFIPVETPGLSEILPRFMKDGTQDFTNYPGTH